MIRGVSFYLTCFGNVRIWYQLCFIVGSLTILGTFWQPAVRVMGYTSNDEEPCFIFRNEPFRDEPYILICFGIVYTGREKNSLHSQVYIFKTNSYFSIPFSELVLLSYEPGESEVNIFK